MPFNTAKYCAHEFMYALRIDCATRGGSFLEYRLVAGASNRLLRILEVVIERI